MLLQDLERTDDGVSLGVSLKDGVSRDRMTSVHDPEMRHGHKSSSRRFNGHKAAIVVDTDSQLITAVEVPPGNAPDNLGALELVEQSEANTGVPVEEIMGDAAYGDGDTREAFADAGRILIARAPGRPNQSHFPKEDFRIDLETAAPGNGPALSLPTPPETPHHISPNVVLERKCGENGRRWTAADELMVPKVGFEPTRSHPHRFLRPARLPFRHFG